MSETNALRVTGASQIMFILCDPVHHVRGTDILNQRMLSDGIDGVVVPVNVGAEDLGDTVTALRRIKNLSGFGVTIPHKIAVLTHLDGLTPEAERIGSVNFVRREPDGSLIGTNVDGSGFVRGALDSGITLAGRRVLQLGAGGAGRAVAFSIAAAGPAELVIWNRTPERAEALAADVSAAVPGCVVRTGDNNPVGFDVLVNTTSAGMRGQPAAAVHLGQIRAGLAVAEIVISPAETPLLEAARAQGAVTSTGAGMLDAQYELMRDFLQLRRATVRPETRPHTTPV